MIHLVNIVGAQCKGTRTQYGQRTQEWGPTQCKYYVRMKHTDPAALNMNFLNKHYYYKIDYYRQHYLFNQNMHFNF